MFQERYCPFTFNRRFSQVPAPPAEVFIPEPAVQVNPRSSASAYPQATLYFLPSSPQMRKDRYFSASASPAFLPEERLELFDRGVVELDFPLVPRGDGFKGVLDPARRAGPCGRLYRILPDSFRRRSCMKLTLQKRILFSRQGVGSGFNDLDLDVYACAQRSALAVYVGIHKGENDLLR